MNLAFWGTLFANTLVRPQIWANLSHLQIHTMANWVRIVVVSLGGSASLYVEETCDIAIGALAISINRPRQYHFGSETRE